MTRHQARQPHRFVVERLEERCLLASLAPTATTQAATNVASTAATLNGSVNPNGSSTDTLFQFSTDPTLPANIVTTLAGSPGQRGSADGTGSAARFNLPGGVAVDSAGNVYVADAFNDTIRKITPAGVVTTLAGTRASRQRRRHRQRRPVRLSGRGGGGQRGQRLRGGHVQRHDPQDHAGRGGHHPGGHARPARQRRRHRQRRPVQRPDGVAVDSAGNVYVADTFNDTIREITPAGVVTTLAGTPGQTGSADGTGSAARFNDPDGVAVDSAGNVYVADDGNDTIRKITPAGVVTTLAGAGPGRQRRRHRQRRPVQRSRWGGGGQRGQRLRGGRGQRHDPQDHAGRGGHHVGGRARPARQRRRHRQRRPVLQSARVAVDSAGNVYVADTGNETIRKLSIPSVPAQSGLTGTSPVAVNATLTGLTPGTTYSFRVVATNVGGTTLGDILSFTHALNTTTTTLTSSSPNNTSVFSQSVTFTATVAVVSPGTGTPTGTVTFKDGSTTLGTGTLSGGVATLTVPSTSPLIAALAVGTHSITADYGGDTNDLPSTSTLVTQVVTPVDGPHVTNVQRFGFHAQPTNLVLQFNEALDPTRAQNVANYQIVGPNGVPVAITSAVYDAKADTVTLSPKTRLDLHKIYTLTVNGTGAQGVSDPSGNLLDGANNGQPGSNFVTTVTAANLVLTDVPGGPLRLKQLRREVAKIAAHELAFLNHALAKTAHVVHDKGTLHVQSAHRKP